MGGKFMENLKSALFDIPIIGSFLEYIFNVQPIIGTIILVIVGCLFINKLVILQLDVNLLKWLYNLVMNRDVTSKYNKERKKFFETTSTKEYAKWQNQMLEKIYDDLPLVELYGRKHMCVGQKSAEKVTYPFSRKMSKFGKLNSFEVPEYQPDRFQKYYCVLHNKSAD